MIKPYKPINGMRAREERVRIPFIGFKEDEQNRSS